MVGFQWGRGGTLRAHISKRGKCRSFFNIKAKQPRMRHHFSTLDQKTQAISYILNAAERGGKDRAAAIKFQAARCVVTIGTVQKWMRNFKAGLITVRKPTAGRPSKCTVEEQTRIEALLEQNNYKITFRALAKLSEVSDKTLRRWAHKWGCTRSSTELRDSRSAGSPRDETSCEYLGLPPRGVLCAIRTAIVEGSRTSTLWHEAVD